MIILFEEFHFDIGIVGRWPLLISPCFDYFLVLDNFGKFATNITAKEDKPTSKMKMSKNIEERYKMIESKLTYSPFLQKSSLTSPRVKAVIGSARLKQSHNSDTLHWNRSSRIKVLQSILTPRGFCSGLFAEGVLALESLMTDLLDVTWFEAGKLLPWALSERVKKGGMCKHFQESFWTNKKIYLRSIIILFWEDEIFSVIIFKTLDVLIELFSDFITPNIIHELLEDFGFIVWLVDSDGDI